MSYGIDQGTRTEERVKEPTARKLGRDWLLLGAIAFLFSFGFGAYNGVFSNFISEELKVGPQQLGVLESLRETPGLLTAFVASALVGLAEPRLAAAAIGVTAVGIAAIGQSGSFAALVFWAVLWSTGFHLWSSVQPSMVLAVAERERQGQRLGQMSSIGAVAGLCALALVSVTAARLEYSTVFLIAGGCMAAAGVACTLLSPNLGTANRLRLVIRREYGLYYWLTFLEGCRRQIFTTFALYVLVRHYHTPVTTIAKLLFLNGVVTLIAAPRVGALTDRLRERRTLSFYYVACFLLFVGYALVHNLAALYVFFCVDALLFSFSIGITTYLQRILREGERTPTLAMGVTFNHVAAVVVPLVGGHMWQWWGYETTFAAGSLVALLSLWSCRRLPE